MMMKLKKVKREEIYRRKREKLEFSLVLFFTDDFYFSRIYRISFFLRLPYNNLIIKLLDCNDSFINNTE